MLKETNEEKIFYNAVAVALDGNPEAMRKIIAKLAKLNSGHSGSRENRGISPGWTAAYEYLADGGKIGRMEPKTPSTMPDPDVEWENLEQRGIRLVFRDEAEYPQLLREIHDPPLALYILGSLPPTQTPSITVVGTRRATPEGKVTTRRFARELASAGLTIVSGLALGIDAEAHAGCLEASADMNSTSSAANRKALGGGGDMLNIAGLTSGDTTSAGTTIAVLARGVDRIYPAENDRLGAEILAHGGAIISEYPPGEPPYPDRFLERNRIVSGLSRGVLVVEAPARSGSLATATFAQEQNRNLFVVPGPITHPNFFGSHQLIRQGAELVTAPEEILEAYGLFEKEKSARAVRATVAATPEEKQVLIALRDAHAPLEVDKIIEMTKLEPRIVNRALSFLLLKHVIKETGAGYIIE